MFFISQNTYTHQVKLFVHLYHLRYLYILNQDFFCQSDAEEFVQNTSIEDGLMDS